MRWFWLALMMGCTSSKVVRLENQLLTAQVTELRNQLDQCSVQTHESDYLHDVTMPGVVKFLMASGHTEVQPISDTIVSIPVDGANTDFRINLQLFEREQVLFMVAAGYLQLEAATSSSNMVLLLTQLVAMNYEMLVGKFQLNPSSGAITLSAEIQIDDGMGFQTFDSVLSHLIKTADTLHPDLLKAAKGLGL